MEGYLHYLLPCEDKYMVPFNEFICSCVVYWHSAAQVIHYLSNNHWINTDSVSTIFDIDNLYFHFFKVRMIKYFKLFGLFKLPGFVFLDFSLLLFSCFKCHRIKKYFSSTFFMFLLLSFF